MTSQTINCTIERRLLVNYRIDPELVSKQLPSPLRPQLVRGWAVGGVCFIRLANTRPAYLPRILGIRSENVAHRYAVEWDDHDETRTGVYVPRRDTDSLLTSIAGGRLFPGRYHLAQFSVAEEHSGLDISVDSRDGQTQLHVRANSSEELGGRLFDWVQDATTFFCLGSLGYSPSTRSDHLDAVALSSDSWAARPVQVAEMCSSVFDDRQLFPAGSCTLDSALLMENLQVDWTTQQPLTTTCPSVPVGADRAAL
ncbi:MAG TPA: DUF2071 domain-containing protein [Acidimicrobiales bacterium]|nr:DUF2071 domain-containing protein [Acidimicrobiales bacterium]